MTMHLLPVYFTTTKFNAKNKKSSKKYEEEKRKTDKLLKKVGFKQGSKYKLPMPDYKTSTYNTNNSIGNGIKKDENRYTGDEIVGIGTMHKSNMVPIRRNSNTAIEIATMRRN
jgi:hypothetical protein